MRPLIILLFLSSFVQAQSLEKGKKFFEEKKPEEAKKLLEAIDDDHKDYAAARYYLGRIAFDKKQYEDAEELFEEAIEANEKVAEYHYWHGSAMGVIAQQSNTLKQGILAPKIKDAFEKTVQLDPKNMEAHWGLIEFYTQAPGFMGGSWEKAEETAKGILRIKKAEGHRAMGIVLERQEKFTEAEGQYVQAFKEDAQYLHTLANFYVTQKKFDKAFSLFEEGVNRNQEDMVSIYQIGRVSALSGQKLELGESCLTKYLSYQPKPNEPKHAMANLRLAQIKEKKGNKPEAKKLYEASLKLDPKMQEAKDGLERVK